MHFYLGSEFNLSVVKPISKQIYSKLFVKLRQHDEVIVFSYENKGPNESGSYISMRNEHCQVTGFEMDVFSIGRPHELEFAALVLIDEARIQIGANGRFSHGLNKSPFVCKIRNTIGQNISINMNCGHLFNVSGLIHIQNKSQSVKLKKRELSYYFNTNVLTNGALWERIKDSVT